MAAVAGGLQKLPDYAPLLHWAPVACWSVAGAGLLVIAASRVQRVWSESVRSKEFSGHSGARVSANPESRDSRAWPLTIPE